MKLRLQMIVLVLEGESINISDVNGQLVEDSTVDVTCNNDTDGKIFLTVTTQPSGNIYGIDWDIDNFHRFYTK